MRPRFLPALSTVLLILVLLALSGTIVFPADAKGKAEDPEVIMGREAAREVAKENKLITDPKITERVEKIGRALAAVANSTVVKAEYGSSTIKKFDYKFHVVDDKTVNAFSLPGGFIYVNKGLLDYVQSDDELAAVLSHEIAHSAHHHMSALLRVQHKLDSQIMFILLAGMLGRVNGSALSDLMIGSQLFRVAKTNGYGLKAETDADATGVMYMVKAGYNPTGMLTFLERLAKDTDSKPEIVMGILQDHPDPEIRCQAVLHELEYLGLPVNRRAVTHCEKAMTMTSLVKGVPITRVVLGNQVLFDPAPIGNVITSAQRAAFIATRINQFLDSEPPMREVTVSSDGRVLLAGGEEVIVVTDQDCRFCGKNAGELTNTAADTLRRTIWREKLAQIE